MKNFFSINAIKIFQEITLKLKTKTLKYRMEIENKIKQREAALQVIDETINETKMDTIYDIIQETATKVAESTTTKILGNKRWDQNKQRRRRRNNNYQNNIHNNNQIQNRRYSKVDDTNTHTHELDQSTNHNDTRFGYDKRRKNKRYKVKDQKVENKTFTIYNNNTHDGILESKDENYNHENKINMDFQYCNQDNLYNNKECVQIHPQGLRRHHNHHQRKQKLWRVKIQNINNNNNNMNTNL
jgi:hypothetical protein